MIFCRIYATIYIDKFSEVRLIKSVEIFTDGACSGNPGPGGYGVVLRFTANGKVYEKELSGGDSATTNNRMELMGVIKGLSALKEPCKVLLTTDSKYVVDSITKGWVYGWKKKGWIKSDTQVTLKMNDATDLLLSSVINTFNFNREEKQAPKAQISGFQRDHIPLAGWCARKGSALPKK